MTTTSREFFPQVVPVHPTRSFACEVDVASTLTNTPPPGDPIRTEVFDDPAHHPAGPRLESLESREVLTAGPSAEPQYMLATAQPGPDQPRGGGPARHLQPRPGHRRRPSTTTTSTSTQSASAIANSPAQPPLAWNDKLAAGGHRPEPDQANNGIQSHTGSDGSTPSQRLDRVGYTNAVAEGENAYAYSTSVDHAMEAFLIDWGVAATATATTSSSPTPPPDQYYRDVGIGIVKTNNARLRPAGHHPGLRPPGEQPADSSASPSTTRTTTAVTTMGEGQGGVKIDATNLATGQNPDGPDLRRRGGYQMPLAPGNYAITARDNTIVQSQHVTVGDQNVEVDYDLSNPWQGGTPAQPQTQSQPQPQTQSQPQTQTQPQPQTQSQPVRQQQQQQQQSQPATVTPATQTASASPASAPMKTATSWFANWSLWPARQSS